jgi:hypothetical protein
LHELARQFELSPGCVELCTDNTGAISLVNDPLSLDRSKHIDVIYHDVRERVACGQVKFLQVPSSENVADIFTKPLSYELFSGFRALLGARA